MKKKKEWSIKGHLRENWKKRAGIYNLLGLGQVDETIELANGHVTGEDSINELVDLFVVEIHLGIEKTHCFGG